MRLPKLLFDVPDFHNPIAATLPAGRSLSAPPFLRAPILSGSSFYASPAKSRACGLLSYCDPSLISIGIEKLATRFAELSLPASRTDGLAQSRQLAEIEWASTQLPMVQGLHPFVCKRGRFTVVAIERSGRYND